MRVISVLWAGEVYLYSFSQWNLLYVVVRFSVKPLLVA